MNIHHIIAEHLECLHGDVVELVEDGNGNVIPPFACRFAPRNGELASIVDEAGNVHLVNLRRSEARLNIVSFSAHQNAIFDVDWLDATHVLTASGDLTLRLVDIECRRPVATFTGHCSSVKCVAVQPASESIFASGSRDGSVRMWDVRVRDGLVAQFSEQRGLAALSGAMGTRIGPERRSMGALSSTYPIIEPRVTFERLHTPLLRRPSATLSRLSAGTRVARKSATSLRRASVAASTTTQSDAANSVTSLLFLNDTTLVTCADASSHVRVWDMRTLPTGSASTKSTLGTNSASKLKPKLCVPYVGSSRKQVGYSHLLTDSTRTRLFAVCSDSVAYEFDMLEVERNTLCCALPFGGCNEADTSGASAPSAIAYRTDQVASGSFYVRASLSADDRLLAVGGLSRAAVYARCPHSHPTRAPTCNDSSKSSGRPLSGAMEPVLPIATIGSFEKCEVSVAEWCPVGVQKLITLADDGTIRVWRYNRRDWRVPALTNGPRLRGRSPATTRSPTRKPALPDLAGIACGYNRMQASRLRASPGGSLDCVAPGQLSDAMHYDRRNHNMPPAAARSCLSLSLMLELRRREYGLSPHPCGSPCVTTLGGGRMHASAACQNINLSLMCRLVLPVHRNELNATSSFCSGGSCTTVFCSPTKPLQPGAGTGTGTFLTCTPIKMTPKKLQIKESPFKSNSAHLTGSGSGSKVDCASTSRVPTLVPRVLFRVESNGPPSASDTLLPPATALDCVDGLTSLSSRNVTATAEQKPSLPLPGSASRIECTYKLQKRARMDGQKTDEKTSQTRSASSSSVTAPSTMGRRRGPTKRKITDYFDLNS